MSKDIMELVLPRMAQRLDRQLRRYRAGELDDDQFEEDKRLRAKVVRPTTRPIGRKLSGRDATFQIITHHPKARRRRPSWRGKEE